MGLIDADVTPRPIVNQSAAVGSGRGMNDALSVAPGTPRVASSSNSNK